MHESVKTFVPELVEFFDKLKPSDLNRLSDFYTSDAFFKDPFNEVSGTSAIKVIFQHMFDTLELPQFVVTTKLFDADQAFITWDFLFALKSSPGNVFTVKGSSHLLFDADLTGSIKIKYHRDYWDPAEDIYEKIPGLGVLIRWIKSKASATQK